MIGLLRDCSVIDGNLVDVNYFRAQHFRHYLGAGMLSYARVAGYNKPQPLQLATIPMALYFRLALLGLCMGIGINQT